MDRGIQCSFVSSLYLHGVRNLALVFEGYWDESGTHNAPLIVVAGYFASCDVWSHLVNLWGDACRRFGIPEYHAKKDKKNRNYDNFMLYVVWALVQSGVRGSVAIVPCREYEKFKQEYRTKLKYIPSAYGYCVRENLYAFDDYVNTVPDKSANVYFGDSQHVGEAFTYRARI